MARAEREGGRGVIFEVGLTQNGVWRRWSSRQLRYADVEREGKEMGSGSASMRRKWRGESGHDAEYGGGGADR
jgi:hypothetical protein